jgi:hypothetical protein
METKALKSRHGKMAVEKRKSNVFLPKDYQHPINNEHKIYFMTRDITLRFEELNELVLRMENNRRRR